MVKPDSILLLEKHFHRGEHLIVVHGTMKVTRNRPRLRTHCLSQKMERAP
jgi:mannose-6-phosphate isomerase-like protein (cupin superfamily)